MVLRLLLHLAEYSGQTVLRLAELLQSAAGCSGLAGAITELQRERRMLSGGSDTTGQKNRPAALHSYQPQDELPSAQGKSREGLRRLNGLAYFLRNGEIPWWCRDLASEPVGLLIKSLLQTNSGLLLNILQSAAVSSRAVDRLIQYVPQQSLSTIIQQAKPDYGGLLILYIEAGTGMAENESLSPVQRSRLGGLHWRETLRFALEEDSAGRTPAQALRLLCSRVSQQLGLTTDKYVRSLLKNAVCSVSSQSGHAALAEILSQKQNRELSLNDIPQNTAVPESLRIEQPAEPAPEASKTTDTVRTERLSGKPSAVLPVSSRVKMHPHVPQKKHEPLRFPNPTNQAGQLEHLLRYGMLPETLSPTTLSQFMENLALDLSSHPELYRDYLRVAINHDLERKRMARLFSPQALNALLQILLPSDHAQASLCLQQLHAAAVQCSTPGTREELSLTCVEELLQTANRLRGNRWSMVAYARCATRRLKEDHSLRVSVLTEKLRERLASRPGNIQQQFSQALDRIEREMAVIPMDPQTPSVQPEPEQRSEAPIEKHSTKFPADQPVYIGNAGAVLLWPFLGRYFQTLGLLEKNAFRSESEKNRAIHLLQYLATGKLETPEHELLLNKVLCGSLPEQPLDPVLPLT
ncbi:MAG TPA: contractile injection system tape measure protein, partial [Candidatus Sulfotelmatobacter sp.]|nr:contractile injection system tape measure protein [Candidatus Sulfotelmatobacter sp.]